MEHIHKTIADLERLKARLDEFIGVLSGMAETGGSLLPMVASISGPAAAVVAPLKDPPTNTDSPAETGKRPKRPAGDHPWNKKAKMETATVAGVGVKTIVRQCVANVFGEAWFSAEGMREAVREAKPDITDSQLRGVVIALIDMTNAGHLESEGSGTDRKYRATGGRQ